MFTTRGLHHRRILGTPAIIVISSEVSLRSRVANSFAHTRVPGVSDVSSGRRLRRGVRREGVLVAAVFGFNSLGSNRMVSRHSGVVLLVSRTREARRKSLNGGVHATLPGTFFFKLANAPVGHGSRGAFTYFKTRRSGCKCVSGCAFRGSMTSKTALRLGFGAIPIRVRLSSTGLRGRFSRLASRVDRRSGGRLMEEADISTFFATRGEVGSIYGCVISRFERCIGPANVGTRIIICGERYYIGCGGTLSTLLNASSRAAVMVRATKSGTSRCGTCGHDHSRRGGLLSRFESPLSPLGFIVIADGLLANFSTPVLRYVCLSGPVGGRALLRTVYEAGHACGRGGGYKLVISFINMFRSITGDLTFSRRAIGAVIRGVSRVGDLVPAFVRRYVRFFPNMSEAVNK